jgi:transcription initiation factor IIE alpha subunit
MVTFYRCKNPKCPNFEVRKSVASAMVLGANPKVCPACGEEMRIATQI